MNSDNRLIATVFGFMSASLNHVYGWMANWHLLDQYGQAIVTGALGAAAGYYALRFIKWCEKKSRNFKK